MKASYLALALLCVPGLSHAYSFHGDWTFNYNSTIHVRTALGNSDITDFNFNFVTVSQTTTDAFSFPVVIGPISGSGDFTVAGTTITDVNGGKTTDPFFVDFNGAPVQVRITYPTWSLVGEINDSNSLVVDEFGERAFNIMGSATTINDVQIEAFLGTWINLGSDSSVDINSWSMNRSADAVPEPSLMIVGGFGIAALIKRKRKS